MGPTMGHSLLKSRTPPEGVMKKAIQVYSYKSLFFKSMMRPRSGLLEIPNDSLTQASNGANYMTKTNFTTEICHLHVLLR